MKSSKTGTKFDLELQVMGPNQLVSWKTIITEARSFVPEPHEQ